ncbi:hypothetical protein M8C21_018191 [Ambrosia artemisiifolia]|uniref:Cobalamin-independent methionine synthase MetE C-terminal/archaeal domain-containing protein n=1 Tax=Ambrosia artemisiifolia TaxID=4212 RepID=A0AAD5D1K7_AMBAR|nr:hypothetical protein M8C21_018191 [Ambrosia artemisiifolia]
MGDRRLGWKGGTISVHMAASYVIALLVGAYHLWVVHGQGRPPDDAADPSLEDKTVLKERIALAIKDEVEHLEKAGITVTQIDEAALREGLPLRS